ncbi:MAG: hypothetical protein IT269_13455 [Saprospiraceae bacterium]|nr:hypothetical protein [Saprospiraceae bacterium]
MIWPDVWRQTARFIRVGVPSALQVMVEFAAFGAGTIIIGQISKVEQAAHQAALNLSSVTYVTIMGISTAGMIRVGQALAYNNRAKVWLSGVASIVLATLFMITPILLFLFVPGFLIGLYSDDPEVIRLGIVLLFFAALFQLADAVQATSISLLRAINDVLKPSFLSFLAFWVVGIPLGYWLAKHQGWNAKGIWMGYLIALIIQAVLFMRRFFTLVRQGKLRGGQ